MKKIIRVICSASVGLMVFVAKAEISSASNFLLYQPKSPEKQKNDL